MRIHSLAGWGQELANVTQFEALQFRLEFLSSEKWKKCKPLNRGTEEIECRHLNTGTQMQEPEHRNSKTAFQRKPSDAARLSDHVGLLFAFEFSQFNDRLNFSNFEHADSFQINQIKLQLDGFQFQCHAKCSNAI